MSDSVRQAHDNIAGGTADRDDFIKTELEVKEITIYSFHTQRIIFMKHKKPSQLDVFGCSLKGWKCLSFNTDNDNIPIYYRNIYCKKKKN